MYMFCDGWLAIGVPEIYKEESGNLHVKFIAQFSQTQALKRAYLLNILDCTQQTPTLVLFSSVQTE